jgi:hypothetical protein
LALNRNLQTTNIGVDMPEKKIITVFGATGGQGGGVASTFLNDPKLKDEWTVRGVTRDLNKDSAKRLAAQGAEVVQVCETCNNSCWS